jgi:ABC-type nitrate/sulfonate/bicarbonate transport system permease component
VADQPDKEPATPEPATPAPEPAPEPAKAKPGARIEDPPRPAAPAKKSAQDLGHPGEPPPWWRTLRADPPAAIRIALGLGLVVLVIGLWWLGTRSGDQANSIPSPGETLGSVDDLLARDFDDHLFATLRRVLIGVALAAVVGIGLGILAGAQRGVAAALNPLVVFLRSIPMGALGPLMIVLFSTGDKSKWMFIFIAVVPFVFGDALKAMSSVPQRYVETAETLGATRWQIVRKVLVPLAIPDIITSLRFQFGLAFGYIVLVETNGFLESGLGPLFLTNDRLGMRDQTMAMLFVLAGIAFFIDFLVRFLQRGMFPYRKDL